MSNKPSPQRDESALSVLKRTAVSIDPAIEGLTNRFVKDAHAKVPDELILQNQDNAEQLEIHQKPIDEESSSHEELMHEGFSHALKRVTHKCEEVQSHQSNAVTTTQAIALNKLLGSALKLATNPVDKIVKTDVRDNLVSLFNLPFMAKISDVTLNQKTAFDVNLQTFIDVKAQPSVPNAKKVTDFKTDKKEDTTNRLNKQKALAKSSMETAPKVASDDAKSVKQTTTKEDSLNKDATKIDAQVKTIDSTSALLKAKNTLLALENEHADLQDKISQKNQQLERHAQKVIEDFKTLGTEYNHLEVALTQIKDKSWLSSVYSNWKKIDPILIAKSILGFLQTPTADNIAKTGLEVTIFKNAIQDATFKACQYATDLAAKLIHEEVFSLDNAKTVYNDSQKAIVELRAEMDTAASAHAPFQAQDSIFTIFKPKEYYETRDTLAKATQAYKTALDLSTSLGKVIELADNFHVFFEKTLKIEADCTDIAQDLKTIERQKESLIDLNEQIKGQQAIIDKIEKASVDTPDLAPLTEAKKVGLVSSVLDISKGFAAGKESTSPKTQARVDKLVDDSSICDNLQPAKTSPSFVDATISSIKTPDVLHTDQDQLFEQATPNGVVVAQVHDAPILIPQVTDLHLVSTEQ